MLFAIKLIAFIRGNKEVYQIIRTSDHLLQHRLNLLFFLIMSAKFKSTKKKPELEAEVDDWDVSDEEGAIPQSTQQYQRKVYQDAWGDDSETNSIERPKVEGRTLWEEA